MTPTRTLLDLAGRYDPDPLLRAVRQAEFHHRLHPDDMLAILRRGHPGSRALRRAIARHVPGYGELKSRLERKFRALLVTHDVELPRRNAKVGIYTVDCLWPALRVIVELDGRQHLRPGQAAIDAERDLFLRSRAYVVRRYTWAQVTGPGRRGVLADLAQTFEDARILAAHRVPERPDRGRDRALSSSGPGRRHPATSRKRPGYPRTSSRSSRWAPARAGWRPPEGTGPPGGGNRCRCLRDVIRVGTWLRVQAQHGSGSRLGHRQ